MRIRPICQILIITSLVIGFVACIEVLENDLEVNAPILVVQASVLDTILDGMSESHPMEVGIFSLLPSESSFVNGGLENFGVENADVSISDTEGNVYDLEHSVDGLYVGESYGKAGLGYQLHIEMPEGSTITSEVEVLTAASVKVDSLSLDTADGVIDVGNGTTGPTMEVSVLMHYDNTDGEEGNYLYKSWREYEFREDPDVSTGFPRICYISEGIDSGTTLIDNFRDDQSSAVHEVSKVNYDFRFGFKLFFHVYQYRLSESTYQYFEEVEQNKSQADVLFAPVPGKISTNIKLEGNDTRDLQGYFTVAGVGYQRIKSSPLDLQLTPQFACPSNSSMPWSNNPLRDFCGDCLLTQNSTLDRPSYW